MTVPSNSSTLVYRAAEIESLPGLQQEVDLADQAIAFAKDHAVTVEQRLATMQVATAATVAQHAKASAPVPSKRRSGMCAAIGCGGRRRRNQAATGLTNKHALAVTIATGVMTAISQEHIAAMALVQHAEHFHATVAAKLTAAQVAVGLDDGAVESQVCASMRPVAAIL
jgi:hypothetical protein